MVRRPREPTLLAPSTRSIPVLAMLARPTSVTLWHRCREITCNPRMSSGQGLDAVTGSSSVLLLPGRSSGNRTGNVERPICQASSRIIMIVTLLVEGWMQLAGMKRHWNRQTPKTIALRLTQNPEMRT